MFGTVRRAFFALTCATLALAGGIFYATFLNLPGLLIVIGGSIANAYLSFQREDVMKAFATIRHMTSKMPLARERLHNDIKQLILWSYIIQARDFVGLEKDSARKIDEPYLRYGLDLVVSGYSADKIRTMMQTVAEAEFERRTAAVTVLRNMAATAPAFGMVGTLIGMVIILNNVGTDISNIGGGLGIAMLSTLYGILVSRLVCLPAADKLLLREESVHFRNTMLTEGLALLAEKQKPFYMQDRLNSFLEPTKQFGLDEFERHGFHRQFALAA